jgi:3-oxoacyl-(acyl-carrier-protein) synthase
MPPIAVTGMGMVSALGCGVDAAWRSVRAGVTGLGPLTLFRSARHGHVPVGQVREDPVALGAPGTGSRNDQLAFLAVREALGAARLLGDGAEPLRARAAIVLGATVGGILRSEQFLSGLLRRETASPALLRHHEIASSTDLCASGFGLLGPCATLSTACSSGAMAIAMAGDLIDAGEAEAVVAVGVDSLCRLTLNGFGSLLLLDPAGCRPFDAGRAGLSLGEGAAALVLEDLAAARRRGAEVLALLSGWGRSCDAHHMTAPDPAARGAADAMRAAIDRAGAAPEDVGYVNAHGTGTRDNDVAEARALKALFGPRLPPVSSSKGFFGHTLAAAGAVEAVVSIQALREGWLPPSPGFSRADPEVGLEPLREGRAESVRHVLSNSFGFGGNNVALVFSSPGAPGPAPRAAVPRLPAALPVTGLGVVSPAGVSPAEVFATARGAGVEPSVRESAPPMPAGRSAAFACREIPEADRLPAARRRRLSRFLEMTLTAARDAVRDASGRGADVRPDETAVLMGTGLGGVRDTSDFLTNLFVHDERTPMPATFIHSVHNAISGQAAIDLGARRMNCTAAHREISFEAALWQARRLVATGEARDAVVGAVDELNPYVIAAHGSWRGWAGGAAPDAPSDPSRLPCGEGAAMITLGAPRGGLRPRAWVGAVGIGRFARAGRGGPFGESECRWIEGVLARDGLALPDIDLVLTGAAGRGRMNVLYAAVVEAIRRRIGRPVRHGAYKRLCGDYCSSSAFGFVIAAGLVGGEIDPAAVRAEPAADRPVRSVLLLTLGRNGEKGMCCVMADAP